MKKFAISLIALAAISTSSFAGNRGFDPRESDTYFGKYSEQLWSKTADVNALAVMRKTETMTNFARMNWISEENQNGGH